MPFSQIRLESFSPAAHSSVSRKQGSSGGGIIAPLLVLPVFVFTFRSKKINQLHVTTSLQEIGQIPITSHAGQLIKIEDKTDRQTNYSSDIVLLLVYF